MKLTVERDPFLKALSRIQTVVERRTTKPILGNALLETDGETIKISATDEEVSLRTFSPAVVVEPGSMTVSAKTLFDVVRELPEETILLRKNSRDRLLLSCGRAKFELAGLPSSGFPNIPQADGNYRFTMGQAVLAEMFTKTHFAISYDESRFTLNGVFFQISPSETEEGEGMVRLVATDTHRLAMVERFCLQLPDEAKEVIIPRKGVQEIRRILEESSDEQKLEIILDSNYIQLIRPGIILVSKLVEGRFPDYRRVIPKGNPLHLNVNREQLLGVVRRMSTLSHEKSLALRLDIEGGMMRFNSNNPEQELAEEEMAISLEGGETLTVGFNARYLKEFLAVMESDTVRFSLKNHELPVLLSDPGQLGTEFVLMPMRV